MKFNRWIITAALLGVAGSAIAETQSTPRIEARQYKQEKRIDKGVQSGALTTREAARLERGQARVDKMEDKAMADGVASKKERIAIERAQDRQSKRIYRQKHDAQTAK